MQTILIKHKWYNCKHNNSKSGLPISKHNTLMIKPSISLFCKVGLPWNINENYHFNKMKKNTQLFVRVEKYNLATLSKDL